jgi:hypothetical protein
MRRHYKDVYQENNSHGQPLPVSRIDFSHCLLLPAVFVTLKPYLTLKSMHRHSQPGSVHLAMKLYQPSGKQFFEFLHPLGTAPRNRCTGRGSHQVFTLPIFTFMADPLHRIAR